MYNPLANVVFVILFVPGHVESIAGVMIDSGGKLDPSKKMNVWHKDPDQYPYNV